MRFVFFSLFMFVCGALESIHAAFPFSQDMSKATLAPLVKKVSPAVVHIQSVRESMYRHPFADFFNSDPFFGAFFGNDLGGGVQKIRETAAGSGNIISEDGLVLTCAHVVRGSTEIHIKLTDNRTFPAKIIKINHEKDLALLKMEIPQGTKLAHLEIGDSESVEVGDFILAAGYPFGISQTMTFGILSAKGQIFRGQNVLQTDASINPGNSGGAFLNMEGKLIGLPNAIISRSGGSQGIGFAIPSSLFKDWVKDVSHVPPLENKTQKMVEGLSPVLPSPQLPAPVTTGTASVGEVSVESGPWKGLKLGVQQGKFQENPGAEAKGDVVITHVPGDMIGPFEVGDVIQKLNGQSVDTPSSAKDIFEKSEHGISVMMKRGEHGIVQFQQSMS